MNRPAKNNTPWRGMASLQLPKSPPHLAAPDQQLQPEAGIRLVQPRVNFTRIAPVAPEPEIEIVVEPTEKKRCQGEGCNATLSRYNYSDLCNLCKARGNRRRA